MKPKKVLNGPYARVKVTPLAVPDFKSEAEEAEWWDTHTAEVDDFVRRAEKAGAFSRGTVAPSLGVPEKTKVTTIRLPEGDIDRAKAAAQRKGLRYQTYLKMLIHEALSREGQAS